jgi:hypothetical protein
MDSGGIGFFKSTWSKIALIIIYSMIVLGMTGYILGGRTGKHTPSNNQQESPQVTLITSLQPSITKLPTSIPSLIRDEPTSRQIVTHANSQSSDQRIAACGGIKNGSTVTYTATSREYISLPEEIYPYEKVRFNEHNASMGIISNGERGPNLSDNIDSNNCWGHYFEFDQESTSNTNEYYVDMQIPSAKSGVPNYSVRFMVVAPK